MSHDTPSNGTIAFTCAANTVTTDRTATVTLTYAYGDDEPVTKDVTITQTQQGDEEITFTFPNETYDPIVNVTTMKFGQWNGFRFGVGVGALGIASPEFAAAPAVDFMIHFLYSNFLLSFDFNWGIDEELGDDDFTYLGLSLSTSYVFDGRTVFPFVGPGVGFSYMEYDTDKYRFGSSGEGLTVFLKTGVLFKPINYKTIFAIDVRYLFNFYEMEKVSRGSYEPVQGWNVSAQVWW